jgi:3-methyladenine DNA glycosylase AlkC
MAPPRHTKEPLVIVDALDLEGKSQEERLQMAMSAINRNGLKPSGNPVYPFREAADAFSVPKTTLIARWNGSQTRKEAHKKERKLTDAQEDVLVEWIIEKGRRNIPLSYSAVAEHARVISNLDIGESWVKKFRTRCEGELKSSWTTGQEKCRAGALNEAVVTDFYNKYEEVKTQFNIKTENEWNMDEKGVQLGIGQRVRVLVDRGQKDVQMVEDGNRELVTIIECVSAAGVAMPPSVVFQGKRRDLEWGRNNPCSARLVASVFMSYGVLTRTKHFALTKGMDGSRVRQQMARARL